MSTPFPVFDLSRFAAADAEGKRVLGREVDAICRETGFLAIDRHGVPPATIETLWNLARDFFDLPYDEKLKAKAPYPGYPYGYLLPQAEALAKSRGEETPPDLKESFNGGPLAVPPGMTDPQALAFCYAETIWPPAPEGFRDAWQAYYREMEGLAARIMRVFAVALELPEEFFERFITTPISALRALNYPHPTRPPEPGQLRAGAHSDYGSLTILLPQAGSGGLEILTPEKTWRPVPPVPGAFVINIGDLMARWTNDRWVSTIHRVVNPPADASGSTRRQSFAYFHQPNWDAEIACLPSCLGVGEQPKYAPVRSGPYLMGKFQATVKPAA
jgi:isopenicillin N synthase-like dioxygenase